MTNFMNRSGSKPNSEMLHYTACGLDDVYLLNGFSRENIDGEEHITIADLDGLWKAIGLHLVTERKVLAPKELRFLREHMRMTQAELAAKIRVSDQSIARWEKGKLESVPGPADFMIRVLFLASNATHILEKLNALLDNIVTYDDEPQPVAFRHGKRKWKEDARLCA